MSDIAPATRRSLSAARRRDAVHRRRGRLILATLGTALCTVLGVGAAGGTYAFLNATADLGDTARITAGAASLLIEGSPSATFTQRKLTPATPVRIAFTVTNSGDTALDLSSTIAVTTAPAPGIVGVTTAALGPVASESACTSAGPGTSAAAVSGRRVPALGILSAGATRQYCLELAVPAGTAATLAGSTFSYRLTIDGAQPNP